MSALLIVYILLLQFFYGRVTAALSPITGAKRVGALSLSPIGVGTWAWGNRFLWQYSQSEDEELQRAYEYLVSKGVNWFDTADSYGTGDLVGQAEVLLGRFDTGLLAKMRRKSTGVSFATKIAPFPSRIGSESMYQAGLESIGRLSRIDILQLHWPPFWVVPQLNEWFEDEYMKAFARLQREGLATQLGVSNYGPKTLARVDSAAQRAGSKIYTNQVQFSLLSRYPIENGLAEECAARGIQPIGYSPLALGLLTDKYSIDRLPAGPRGLLFRETLPKIAPLLSELRQVAQHRGKTVSQVALNWNLSKGFLLLVGVRSVEQAKENLGALGWKLTPAEVGSLDVAASKCRVQLVQNSFQTP